MRSTWKDAHLFNANTPCPVCQRKHYLCDVCGNDCTSGMPHGPASINRDGVVTCHECIQPATCAPEDANAQMYSALKAIAGMKVDAGTNFSQLAALCVRIAQHTIETIETRRKAEAAA